VQGAIESPYRGRSYLGKRRRVKGRISKFHFRSVLISGMRFIIRGRFLTRCFKQGNETLGIIHLYKYIIVCCIHAIAYFLL
jgi:hypothetical protein